MKKDNEKAYTVLYALKEGINLGVKGLMVLITAAVGTSVYIDVKEKQQKKAAKNNKK